MQNIYYASVFLWLYLKDFYSHPEKLHLFFVLNLMVDGNDWLFG